MVSGCNGISYPSDTVHLLCTWSNFDKDVPKPRLHPLTTALRSRHLHAHGIGSQLPSAIRRSGPAERDTIYIRLLANWSCLISGNKTPCITANGRTSREPTKGPRPLTCVLYLKVPPTVSQAWDLTECIAVGRQHPVAGYAIQDVLKRSEC